MQKKLKPISWIPHPKQKGPSKRPLKNPLPSKRGSLGGGLGLKNLNPKGGGLNSLAILPKTPKNPKSLKISEI